MVDIVTSNFYLIAGEYNKKDFEAYSIDLFEKWSSDVKATITFEDYSLYLVVEEGSIKGVGKVVAGSLTALYFGIASYGSFVSGVKTISSQGDYVTQQLFTSAKDIFDTETKQGNTRKTTGSIQYLRGLFERVERKEMTPDRAIENIISYFGDEAYSVPGFIEDVSESFYQLEKLPDQLPFDEKFFPMPAGSVPEIPKNTGTSTPRKPIPKPDPSDHYRIVITRDSRSQDRKVTISRVK